MGHTPDFKIISKDNVVWLMDKTNSVFCFDPDLIRFGSMHLTPGGFEMFPRPGMVWGPYGWFFPYWGYQLGKPELVSFDHSIADNHAIFRLVTENKKKGIRSDWNMTVRYDADLESYSYDVKNTGTYIGVTDSFTYDPLIWEYFDLFPQNLFDYKTGPQFYKDEKKVEFPPPLWGYIVYQRGDDMADRYAGKPTWMKVPLNRFVTSASGKIRVARDGYLGLMNSDNGNPMVQILGDTHAFTRVEQCNWFYDLHFLHDQTKVKAEPPKGFSITAEFRIVNFNREQSEKIMKNALLTGCPPREREQKRYPRYEESGINSFENSVTIDAPEHSRIWQPFHHHIADYHPGVVRIDHNQTPENQCNYVSDCARTGARSLQIVTTVDGIAGWQTPLFDRPIVKPGKRYRLSVYIKTKGLEGAGATLGYFPGTEEKSYRLSSRPEEALKVRPVFAEKRVAGDSDWTLVEIITEPMTEQVHGKMFEYEMRSCLIQPVLWHEGKGKSWFDDFIIDEYIGP